MSPPVFVVVGHVNRGKSSIVSTLTADDSVRIESAPGTTRRCREFPLRVDDRVLYTLVDTPGFERARQVLAWLRDREQSVADRPEVARRFLDEHECGEAYQEECRLLRPIVDGGAILYVVDGSVPFSPKYEAEMEILRWTGRPRIALINPIGPRDHVDEWRQVLDQYFRLVRGFNAHGADFADRLRLLRALREVDESMAPSIDAAIDALRVDRDGRLERSARLIAEMVGDVLSHVESRKLGPNDDAEVPRRRLAERYYQHLRDRERRAHLDLREVYQHHVLEIDEDELDTVEEDLFDTHTWSRLGLSRRDLLIMGAGTGMVAGGAIDAAAGGASFLLGAAIGTVVGGAAGWVGFHRLARVRMLGGNFGGKELRIGPMTNVQFAWVLLDRALLYHDLVANRAHARREPVQLLKADQTRAVGELPAERQKEIEGCLKPLRKRRDGRRDEAAVDELTRILADLLNQRDAGATNTFPNAGQVPHAEIPRSDAE